MVTICVGCSKLVEGKLNVIFTIKSDHLSNLE